MRRKAEKIAELLTLKDKLFSFVLELSIDNHLEPVVQSIISLMVSLIKSLLILLIPTKSGIPVFLLTECEELLQCKSSTHFSAENGSYLCLICFKF